MNEINLSVRTLANPFISNLNRLPDQSEHAVNIGDVVLLKHEDNIFSVSVIKYNDKKLIFSGKLQEANEILSKSGILDFKEENILEIRKV